MEKKLNKRMKMAKKSREQQQLVFHLNENETEMKNEKLPMYPIQPHRNIKDRNQTRHVVESR